MGVGDRSCGRAVAPRSKRYRKLKEKRHEQRAEPVPLREATETRLPDIN